MTVIITPLMQREIFGVVIAEFAAAPGGAYANTLGAYVQQSGSVKGMANMLTSEDLYKFYNPDVQTANQFADKLLVNFGLTSGAAYDSAKAWVVGNFNAGMSKGDISYAAVQYLLNDAARAPAFNDAANVLKNKITVSEYYSTILNVQETNIDVLQSVLVGITADPATVVTAKHNIDVSLNVPPEFGAAPQPVGNEDTVINGTLSATDANGGTLVFSANPQGNPSHGTVVVNANGTFAYTPFHDYNGNDTFSVIVTDALGATAQQQVIVRVIPVNDPPVFGQAPAPIGAEDSAIAGSVTATDVDGNLPVFSANTAAGPAHGSVVVQPDGTFIYTPAPNYFGSDSFGVTVTDSIGGTANQIVNVTISPVNDAPVFIVAPTASGNEDAAVIAVNVVGSATDIDSSTLTYSLVSSAGPAHGTVVATATNGVFNYTPAANYNGTDTFDIQVSDGAGGTATQTVTVTVVSVIDPSAVVSANVVSVNEGQTVTYTVATTDVPPGTVFNYTLSGVASPGDIGIPLTGTVTVGANGLAQLIVPTVADNASEGNETMTVAFSTGTVSGQTVIISQTGPVTVVDTSKQYTASVSSPTVTEGDAGVTMATFTVTLSTVATADVTVSYSTANGTATGGTDYVVTSGNVVIPAGQSTATVMVPVTGDIDVEATETFTLNVSSVSFSNSGNAASGTATITNDDTPTAVVSPSVTEVNEGSAVLYTVATGKVPAGTVLSYSITGTVSGVDISVPLMGNVTVDADGFAYLPINIVSDQSLNEGAETMNISFSGMVGTAAIGVTNPAAVLINDTSTAQTTFNLTTGIDNVVGSPFDDTINANAATLNPGDVINGNAGIDTLVFSNTATSSADLNLASFQMTSVERLKTTADGAPGGDVNYDLSGVTGLTTVIDTNSTNDVEFNQLTNLVKLEVTNLTNPNTDVTLQFQDTVVTGGNDIVNVELNSNQSMDNINIGRVGDANGGIETVNIDSRGSGNFVDTLNTELTTLNVTGAASLTINDSLENTVRTINASTATGALNLRFQDNNSDGLGQGVTFTGSAGVNTIYAGDASDSMTGGASGDFLYAANGDNTVHGMGGSDVITAGTGNDRLYGEEGNDDINAGNGWNSVYGGTGNDVINTGTGRDYVEGGDDNDTIFVANGGDTPTGDKGVIYNTVYGGAGNDNITSGDNTDYLDGGDGNDTIYTGQGGGAVGYAPWQVFETVIGGQGADTVYAQGGYKFIDLGTENDIAIFGGNSLNYSQVSGGAGEDTVRVNDMAQVTNNGDVGQGFNNGSSGVEVLQFANATSGYIDGRPANTGQNTNGAGVVTYQFQNNLVGNATLANIVNNANVDFIDGGNALGGYDVTLSNVSSTGSEVVNINVLTSGNVSVAVNEVIDDLTVTSNETVNLNVVNAGGPIDTLTINKFNSGDTRTLNITNAITAHAGMGSASGTDNVTISAFATPSLTLVDGSTASGNLVLEGGSFAFGQNVTMKGGSGNDSIASGDGNDMLYGNNGHDTLVAGFGVDSVYGGEGNDVFEFKDSDLTAADSISGGNGTDSVKIISGNVFLGDASFYRWSSVEVIDLSNTAAGVNLLQLGSIADAAGIQSVIGGMGSEQVYFVEGYDNPITIELGTGNDIVNGDFYADQLSFADTLSPYVGQITVTAAVSAVTAGDTLQGRTGTGDILQLTADNGDAYLDNVSGFDILNILGTPWGDATIHLVDGNVASGATMTVNSTTLGDLTFLGASETNGKFNLTSSSGDDYIMTGAGNDTVSSDGGNDQINGGAGVDSISSGDGNDVIVGGLGGDNINAGDGSDVIVSTGGDVIQVGAGDQDGDVVGIAATSVSGGVPSSITINGWGSEDTLRISPVLVTGSVPGQGSVSQAQGDIISATGGEHLISISTTAPAGVANANLAGAVVVAAFLQTNQLSTLNGWVAGQRAVFALQDGTNTYLWLFTSDGSDNTNATEFQQIGVINGYTGFVNMAADYVFTNFDDTVFVTPDSTVDGLDGFDTITLSAPGEITMTAIEDVYGTSGNDIFTFLDDTTASAHGNGGTDIWNMGAGQTLTIYSTGTINGYAGNDGGEDGGGNGEEYYQTATIIGGEHLILGEGSSTNHDVLVNSVETVTGSTIDDIITFGTNNDATVDGGGGNDELNLAAGGQAVSVDNVDTVNGGGGNDTITFEDDDTTTVNGGGGYDNVILAAGGQNVRIDSVEFVDGTAGSGDLVRLAGGGQQVQVDGVESVHGGSGNDMVILSDGTQTLTIDNAVESVTGGSGLDTVNMGSGGGNLWVDNIDKVNGGSGNDHLFLANGTQTVTIDGYVESVTGGSGNDTLYLDGGSQTVTIDEIDTVIGNGSGSGDTVILVNGAGETVNVGDVDSVQGGTGADVITFTTDGDATVNADGGTDTVNLDEDGQKVVLRNVESVNGGSGDDEVIFKNNTTAVVNGAGGNDTVRLNDGSGQTVSVGDVETTNGGTGDDTINFLTTAVGNVVDGGLGDDVLNLTNGNDVINVADVETVNGAGGNDTVNFTSNVTATVNGGADNDTVNLSDGGQAVNVADVEVVMGGDGDDVVIYDTNTTATIDGADGNDRLVLADGGQTVEVSNVETITGGDGDDLITYMTPTTATIDGGIGNDTLNMGNGGQTVNVSNVESIMGGDGNDHIIFDNFADNVTVNGTMGGVDTVDLADAGGILTVINGIDVVNGGDGDDVVDATGNNASITIVAGSGVDSLLGSNQNDLFQFAGNELTSADTVDGNGGAGDTVEITSSGSANLANVDDVEILKLDGTTHTISNQHNQGTDLRTVNLASGAAATVTFNDQLGNAYGPGTVFTVTINGDADADTIDLDSGALTDNSVLFVAGANGGTVIGGSGSEKISAAGSAAGVEIQAGTGSDSLTGSDHNDVFVFADGELNDSGLNDDTVFGGTGNDTIKLQPAGGGANDFTNVTSVEVISLGVTGTYELEDTGGMGLLSINGSSGDDNIFITDDVLVNVTVSGAGGNDVLDLGGTNGGTNTISVNGMETVTGDTGTDNITVTDDGPGNASVLNGGDTTTVASGNDTFTLTGATAVQTILFGNTAANNGNDTVTGFTAGTGGDVLNFAAFLGNLTITLASGDPFTGNPGGSVNVSNTIFRLIDQNDGQDMNLGAGFTTGVAGGGEFANIDMGANAKAVALVANLSSDAKFDIMYLTSDGASAITATLVGTVNLDAGQDIYSMNFTTGNVVG